MTGPTIPYATDIAHVDAFVPEIDAGELVSSTVLERGTSNGRKHAVVEAYTRDPARGQFANHGSRVNVFSRIGEDENHDGRAIGHVSERAATRKQRIAAREPRPISRCVAVRWSDRCRCN